MSIKSNKLVFNTDMKRKTSKKSTARYTNASVPEVTKTDEIPAFVDELFDESDFDMEDEFGK